MKNQKIIINWILTSYITSNNFDLQKSILFLHGWGQNKESFEKIYSVFGEKWISYIWLDFPGFWLTDFPPDDWDIYDYANFTKDFIEKIWLKKPVLVWHSFGWRVWLLIWSDYKNIQKLILIWAAWIKPETNQSRDILTKIWKIVFSLPWLKWVWEKIKSKIWSRDYLNSWRLKQIFLKVINEDLRKYLSQIKIETLLIRWDKDEETPVLDWELMNNLIPNSKLKVFPNATHFVFQELSKEVSKEILDFIK